MDPLLRTRPPERPILLVVDALDEALAPGRRNIVWTLRERLDDLPEAGCAWS